MSVSNNIDECHNLAKNILNFDKDYAITNGYFLEDINCICYDQPGEEGHRLIVSLKDNSILWAGKTIPIEIQIKAFKDGIRTDKNILKKIINNKI